MLVIANCVVLLVAGVGFCFWTIYYTDWFPVIGGLLGLTGAFAWIGVLGNLITEHRKTALQDWVDRELLQTWTPCVAVGAAGCAFFLLIAARTGAVVADATADEVARTVTITAVPHTSEPAAELSSSPGTSSSALLRTGLFSAKDYEVVAGGLPGIRVTVRSFQRHRLKLPNDPMTAPVILLRPDSTLSGMSIVGKHALEVTVDGKKFGRIDSYRGTTVWVGATRDVAIPRETSDRWRADDDINMKDSTVRELMLARWRTPSAIPGTSPLLPGMQVRAAVVSTEDGQSIGVACRTVTVPNDRHEFPEELVIHDRNQCE